MRAVDARNARRARNLTAIDGDCASVTLNRRALGDSNFSVVGHSEISICAVVVNTELAGTGDFSRAAETERARVVDTESTVIAVFTDCNIGRAALDFAARHVEGTSVDDAVAAGSDCAARHGDCTAGVQDAVSNVGVVAVLEGCLRVGDCAVLHLEVVAGRRKPHTVGRGFEVTFVKSDFTAARNVDKTTCLNRVAVGEFASCATGAVGYGHVAGADIETVGCACARQSFSVQVERESLGNGCGSDAGIVLYNLYRSVLINTADSTA